MLYLKRHSITSLIGCSMTFFLCLSIFRHFQPATPETPPPLDALAGRYQDQRFKELIRSFLENFGVDPSTHLTCPHYLRGRDMTSRKSRWETLISGLLGRDARDYQQTRHSLEPRQATNSNPLGALGGLLGGVTGTGGNSITSELGGLLSGGLSSLGNGLLSDLVGPALFLGIGLGTGTATGLNMSTTEQADTVATSVAAANDMNTTGINGVAMNLGNGLASAAVPLVVSNFSQSSTTGSFASLIAQAVFPLAQGIGNGTAFGLRLTQDQFSPSNGTGIGDIAGNLGLGSSESLARSISTAEILNSSLLSGLMSTNLNLSGTLQAAGVGIGQGAAQGFGVIKQTISTNAPTPDKSFNVQNAVEAFSSGLTSSFLESADLSSIGTKFGAFSLSNNISLPTIVEGVARGLVDGAVSAASAAGGVTKLLSGNASFSALMQPLSDMVGTGLDNTMSGASIAFGRGLGYEGVLVGGAIASKGISNIAASSKRSEIPAVSSLLRRDVNSTGTDPVINSTLLSFLAQRGVNALQCDGIGGLGSIFIGLTESKTISVVSITSLKLDNSTASLLPTGASSVQLDGNTFDFDLRDLTSAKVNGLSIVPFAVVLVLHILLVVTAFFFALPVFMVLNSTQTISEFLHCMTNSTKSQRWQKRIIFFIFLPIAFIGVVFGFIGMGNSRHLRTAHGILGFMTLLITIAYGISYFYRLRDPHRFSITLLKMPPKMSPILLHGISLSIVSQLAIASFITGFEDLRSFSLCFAQALLSLPVTVFLSIQAMMAMTTALAVVGLRLWMEFRLQSTQDKDRTVMEKDRKKLMEPRVQNSAKKTMEIKHHWELGSFGLAH